MVAILIQGRPSANLCSPKARRHSAGPTYVDGQGGKTRRAGSEELLKLKILLINYEYPPVGAGAATATQALARQFVSMGHEATVLTTAFQDLRGVQEEGGVKLVRIPSTRRRCESATISEMISFMLHSLRTVRHLAASGSAEGMIAFFSFPSGPAAWWAHRAEGLPYIVSLRGGDVPGAEKGLAIVHRFLQPLRRRILSSAYAVVANSPGLARLSERADPTRVLTIPNGVDTDFYNPGPSRKPSGRPFKILFVGRFQEQKNLFWLLEQLAVFKEGTSTSFTLDLVGDGPQREGMEAAVDRLGLRAVVRFHGWKDRSALRTHYQEAHLLVNPSIYEGMPNVILEAMACGLPILASRVPGNDATVEHGISGLLFPSGNSAIFASRLRELTESPDMLDRLGLAARQRVVNDFSWARAAQSYLELLAAALPTSRAA